MRIKFHTSHCLDWHYNNFNVLISFKSFYGCGVYVFYTFCYFVCLTILYPFFTFHWNKKHKFWINTVVVIKINKQISNLIYLIITFTYRPSTKLIVLIKYLHNVWGVNHNNNNVIIRHIVIDTAKFQ